MNEHFISRTAVYLLSIVMIVFGVYHFLQPKMMLIYVPDWVPGGLVWVYFTGAAFILAAVAFLTNKLVKLAGYMLAALLLVFVLTIHLPNYLNAGDVDMQRQAFVNLLKDTAIMAFALFVASNAVHQRINEAEGNMPTGRVVTLPKQEPSASI
ncbi:hypothetical protein SAMN05444008_108160 [Cnuella takakiae]|uniref:DoxX protein n=1 Tax=Cnuella takakiae TaxID=1302690 RepID=A0A1M5BZC7_9BACT|nr:hypothetical protein [Cnuella takakiae]OLY93565.1 hypothetical protein BUE76_18060 [Cnuella takakiae]SHF47776.1 hypothetical protein SAMN05444008_108160 [Cnuella takakiae]